MVEHEHQEEASLKDLFVPFTNTRAVLFLVIIGFTVFLNSIFNPFQLDDFTQIVNNPVIYHLGNIPYFFHIGLTYMRSVETHSLLLTQYRPLLYTFYTILYAIFGGSPIPFHLLQLVIHIANTALVFLLFSRFLTRKLAFFLSLLFLVHPINSEAVIYIADLQDVLFVFFGLIAFTIILNSKASLLSYKTLSYTGVSLLLSLLAKETGVVFLIMLPIYFLIFKKTNFTRITLVAVSTLSFYFLLRYIAAQKAVPIMSFSLLQRTPLVERLINIPQIVLYYISKFVLPIHLAVAQDWVVKQITWQSFILPLLLEFCIFACMAIFGVVLYIKKHTFFRWYLFFGLWFGLGLGIHLQIIPLDTTVADRYFYFPIIGLLGMLSIVFSSLARKVSHNRLAIPVTTVLFCMLLLVFSFLTVQRNAEWHTQLSLYSHDVQYAGDSPLLYANYGGLLLALGQFDKAEPYLARSVALDPQLSHNLNNLAVFYEHKKDYSQAKNLYWRNIHTNAVIARYVAVAYCGLARIALLHEKNPQEAKRLSEIGLQKNPIDTQLLKFLALSDYQLGQKDEALAVAKKLYVAAPDQGQALYEFIQNNKPMSLVDPLYGVTYAF